LDCFDVLMLNDQVLNGIIVPQEQYALSATFEASVPYTDFNKGMSKE